VKKTQILDVTLRDGGYRNNFNFSEHEIEDIIKHLVKSNIYNIEIGYFKRPLSEIENIGLTGDLTLELIEKIQCLSEDINITIMCHPEHINISDLYILKQSAVNVIRFCLPKTITLHTILLVKKAKKLGFFVALNFTHISEYQIDEIERKLQPVLNIEFDVLYFADSNGHSLPEEIQLLFRYFSKYPIKLGFHGHDNIGLSLYNSIVAINEGARYIDASIGGLGKGGGNLDLLSITSFLARTEQINCNLFQVFNATKYITKKDYYNNLNVENIFSGLLNINAKTMNFHRKYFERKDLYAL